ncbi:hypothetical protein [Burkholderia anthina]|uniref:hypothetical protein n=1 Tax=Burkholderia anthina TaxID=179879 RepID=UPI0012DA13D8|nr:hypothetical protein [Burkholderia anthina]
MSNDAALIYEPFAGRHAVPDCCSLPFDTTLSADTASTVPTDFSTDSAEGRSPPAIRHPAEVEVDVGQSSGFRAVGPGPVLHATLSAGVAATAGIASISARTPIDVRTVLVIDGPRLNSPRA